MYNYREHLLSDIETHYNENKSCYGYDKMSKSKLVDAIYENCWLDDSVTGNASGSYTFSTSTAEDYLAGNHSLLIEALGEFGYDSDSLRQIADRGAEWCDVTIRCYLLNECVYDFVESHDFDDDED